MIHTLTNRAEVEQGIKEAAEERAVKLVRLWNMTEVMLQLLQWSETDIAVVLARDARPKGIEAKLSALEMVALRWSYVHAFASAMETRCEDEEEARIKTLAAAVLCRRCARPFLHPNHGDDLKSLAMLLEPKNYDHLFTCPHGEEVIDPRECVEDHPEAHDARH